MQPHFLRLRLLVTRFDLIILDQKELSQDVISTVENYSAQNGGIARLFVADLDNLSKFVLPVQGKSDFILSTATIQEFSLRCSLLFVARYREHF